MWTVLEWDKTILLLTFSSSSPSSPLSLSRPSPSSLPPSLLSLYSTELLLLHQLFLRGLHSCIDKWPVVVFGKSTAIHNYIDSYTVIFHVHLLWLSKQYSFTFNSCVSWFPPLSGDLLKLFTPMFCVYHKYIGDHSYAYEVRKPVYCRLQAKLQTSIL